MPKASRSLALTSQREPNNISNHSFSEFYINDRGGTKRQTDPIDAYLKKYNTVWATAYDDTNSPYVIPYVGKGIDDQIHKKGMPNYNREAELIDKDEYTLFLGGYNTSNLYDFEGQISQLVIFNHVLEESEIVAVMNYLEPTIVPEPSSAALIIGLTTIVFVPLRRKFSK